MNISVAMATYNGSEYLVSQLDSIAAQTLLPEEIIICDDCSSDETINIIERHQLFKIIKLNVNEHRIGIVENFKKATALCKFDNFIAFADQDDIWLPTKLEKNHNALGALNCQNLPALVYSDAIFVNKNGDILNYSFMKEMGIDKFKHNFETVLFGSLMLGCTIMFNSKMREVLLTLPSNANFNHDAWVSLASFSFGVNYFIKEPLILYRKHEKNSTISAYKKINRFNKIKKFLKNIFFKNDYLLSEISLAEAFKDRYYFNISDLQKNRINRFLKMKNLSFFIKKIYFELSFFKHWNKRF